MAPSDSTNSDLPADAIVERSGQDDRTVSFSPGEMMRFMGPVAPGVPDFMDETAERGASAPLHQHPWATWELVIEGRVRFVIDGEDHVVESGDFIYTPPNTPHTFIVESDTARMVGLNHPGGKFESFQTQAAPLFLTDGPPDMAQVGALATEHGVEVLGPPLQLAE